NTQDYFAHFQNAASPLLDFLNVAYIVTDPGAALNGSRYELVYDGPDGRIYRNRHVVPRFYAVRNVVLEFRPFAYAQRLSTMRDFDETAMVSRLPIVSDAMRGDLLAPRLPGSPEPYVNFSRVSDTNYTLGVRSPRHALIVSSIPFWPGWRVEVNGERAEPLVVNGAFLGFTVPPGDSAIRVEYVPMTFYAGLIVSALAIAGVVAGATMKR
ncbi:MAG TPA: YfhO family protein, partial [Thermoanaerobaculia bacterium]|nr:YfhO family protein [Thermoanaerobaculia bacterium]